jgi:hypothetical protein
MSLRPILLALLCTAGCRVAPAPRPSPAAPQPSAQLLTVRRAGAVIELSCTKPDTAVLGPLGSALLEASGRIARWGSLRSAVRVEVLQDHAALEQAVGKPGHDWLLGWSYGDRVLLQSPRTWDSNWDGSWDGNRNGHGDGNGEAGQDGKARQGPLLELLTHELTHSLMYQLLEPDDLPYDAVLVLNEEPPLWFREGMASVTANQGKRRLTPDELRAWLALHPGQNPLAPDAELVRTEKEAVYGAAHRAFERLLELGGDQAVRDVLRGMRSGARFADAFAAATGKQASDFERATLQSGFAASAAPKAATGAGGP